MRSPYEEKPYEHARHLTFHTSQGAHGHRDINAITVYAYGRELLIDPGIRSYALAQGWRFRKSGSAPQFFAATRGAGIAGHPTIGDQE